MNVRQAWSVTKESLSSWSDDYAPSMGAALSYYTLFSIAPLLMIVIAIAGLFFGADAVRGVILAQMQSLIGDEGAKAIQEMLSSSSHPSTGGIAAAASVIGLLIGATTVFNELQSDLDRIWRVPAREKASGIWTLLRTRLLSFGMILGVAFLLTVSLVTSAALAAFGKWWGAWFGGWEIVAHALDLIVSFGLLTLIFALVYKMIPRVHVGWRDVWTGAAVTSLLFTIGKFLIGLYLGKSDVTSSFGAAGSFAILMVWVYYSSQIFLLGAEFTWVYANRYGSRRYADTAAETADAGVPTRSASEPAANVQPAGAAAASATPDSDTTSVPARAAHAAVPEPATASASSPRASFPRHAEVVMREPLRARKTRAAWTFAVATALAVGVVARVRTMKRFGGSHARVRPA